MTIAAGSRLGPYEVLGQIGAGGMGEVYRARDTKLGRDVAIKVLPELFAADPDRLARFSREAQVLHFPEAGLFLEEPTISPDGRFLYYCRENGGSSLWLMTLEDQGRS